MLLWPHHHRAVLPKPTHQPWQGRRVPEGVHIVRGTGELAEATFEIGLADLDLFAKAVATGKVAIWLNPPAARNLPASGGHMLHDPPEQVWIETLNDIVNTGFATGEDEILVVIKAVAGRAAGGQRLVHRSEEHTSELQSLMRIS